MIVVKYEQPKGFREGKTVPPNPKISFIKGLSTVILGVNAILRILDSIRIVVLE